MVALVFIVAVVNVGLGYALAELLSRPVSAPPYAPPPPRKVAKHSVEVPSEVRQFPPEGATPPAAEPVEEGKTAAEGDGTQQADDAPQPEGGVESPPLPDDRPTLEVDASPVAPAAHDIPAAWLSVLEAVGPVNSFVEAAIEVLKLQVGEYRDQLVAIDRKARGLNAASGGVAWAACLGVLREVNDEWRTQQQEAVEHLKSRQGGLGDYGPLGRSMIEVLDQQAAQIESTSYNINQLKFAADAEQDRQALLRELGRLLDLAHSLRDLMHESTVQVLLSEDRLATLEKSRFQDEATGLLNRVGLEAVFDEWWRTDPTRQRQLSAAVVDIDGFGDMCLERGWSIGDRVLRGLGVTIDTAIRKSRGFDRAARISGQRFLLFFGDTGPRGATSSAERFRQSLEASTFETQGSELHITCTCGVVEVAPREKTQDVLNRLSAAIVTARQLGRGHTALDEGQGPATVDAPTFDMQARVVRLQD